MGTRTPDLYRVKAHLSNPCNNLDDRGGPPKTLQMPARRSFDGLKNGLDSLKVSFLISEPLSGECCRATTQGRKRTFPCNSRELRIGKLTESSFLFRYGNLGRIPPWCETLRHMSRGEQENIHTGHGNMAAVIMAAILSRCSKG